MVLGSLSDAGAALDPEPQQTLFGRWGGERRQGATVVVAAAFAPRLCGGGQPPVWGNGVTQPGTPGGFIPCAVELLQRWLNGFSEVLTRWFSFGHTELLLVSSKELQAFHRPASFL